MEHHGTANEPFRAGKNVPSFDFHHDEDLLRKCAIARDELAAVITHLGLTSDVALHYSSAMRTTLNIADDVYFAAQRLAERRHQTVSEVISELLRSAMLSKRSTTDTRNGVRLFPPRKTKAVVTLELVNRIRDEE
jgi:hypothetical protein